MSLAKSQNKPKGGRRKCIGNRTKCIRGVDATEQRISTKLEPNFVELGGAAVPQFLRTDD